MSFNRPLAQWRGRRVWIVGASSGIGAALARALAAAGARLALSARGKAALEALAAELPDALALPLDVRDAQALAAAHATIRERMGGIDVAVLNAGIYSPMRADAFDAAVVEEHFAVNFLGVTRALATLLPDFVARAHAHPALVLVSSVAGYRGLPHALAYGPSKAALINLAETLYLDLSPRGIGVFLVNPGFVDTPLTRQNRFHMPALIGADDAARHIIEGLADGAFEIHFPKRFTRWMKLLRILPHRLAFAAVRRATGS